MKKIIVLLSVILTFSCAPIISHANNTEVSEKNKKVELLPRPYSENDLLGRWLYVDETPDLKFMKVLNLKEEGVAELDAMTLTKDGNVQQLHQVSEWDFDKGSNVFSYKVISSSLKRNGEIVNDEFFQVNPTDSLVKIVKKGNSIFLVLTRGDGTTEYYKSANKIF
ncbi:hypothetical protein AB7179_00110 [Providencia manganoxydans]|uniref:hypothetical protein n=1 Tax=Providencia TaxID=586 RepID=UPI002349670F|nr:hypothetical protein [Providencia sp. PROV266]HEF8772087.1 hypothetical protein [Providencia stuartii]